jgi:hypothetical protein
MKMKKSLLLLQLVALSGAIQAQTCSFSSGKNLAELTSAVYEKAHTPAGKSFFFQKQFTPLSDASIQTMSPVFLPQWSAEALPFFCKIEHKWGKKSRIPLKFRLGSVEYVDWLEGK